jgi:hypothetical protein
MAFASYRTKNEIHGMNYCFAESGLSGLLNLLGAAVVCGVKAGSLGALRISSAAGSDGRMRGVARRCRWRRLRECAFNGKEIQRGE